MTFDEWWAMCRPGDHASPQLAARVAWDASASYERRACAGIARREAPHHLAGRCECSECVTAGAIAEQIRQRSEMG